MGYDTSWHAVDVELVTTRVLPFIEGAGSDSSLDDIFSRAVYLYRVLQLANSWQSAAYDALRPLRARDGGPRHDPHVRVWERPFFIVADGPEDVAVEMIHWLNTPLEKAEARAREMAECLQPGLGDKLQPVDETRDRTDQEIYANIARPLLLLRTAMSAALAGQQTIVDTKGESHNPRTLLGANASFHVLQLMGWLTPGWISRGWWPTLLYIDADLEAPGFGSSAPLYAALSGRLPDIEWSDAETITKNWSVGGFVHPKDVAATRAELAARREDLLRPHPTRYSEEIIANLIQVDEAMALAARLGFGFCEATEIYGCLWC